VECDKETRHENITYYILHTESVIKNMAAMCNLWVISGTSNVHGDYVKLHARNVLLTKIIK
jgi:hypothetical protein